MPLFMDYHKGLNVSIEEVKRAHIADEAVQSKYGVTYHQFWVNEEEGAVFCLMEGPDKESCAAVHREAHGNMACSIVEVAPGFYRLLMGCEYVIDQGHVRRRDGSGDPGIRHILAVNIDGVAASNNHRLTRIRTNIPFGAKERTLFILSQHGGREVNAPHEAAMICVFDSSVSAIRCALAVQKEFHAGGKPDSRQMEAVPCRLGLASGQPLSETGDLFSDVTTLARRLCSVANADELLVSTKFQDFCNVKDFIRDSRFASNVRLLAPREESFLSKLYAVSEEQLCDENFTVDSLSRNIGISRPQLYRKIIALTGKAPNDFIRGLRMDKALSLIKKKAGNISEIALEVGYSNPSYFAKCFQLRYGCKPSRFTA